MSMALLEEGGDEVLFDEVLLAAVDAAVSRRLRRPGQHAAAPSLVLSTPQKKLMITHVSENVKPPPVVAQAAPTSDACFQNFERGDGGRANYPKQPGYGGVAPPWCPGGGKKEINQQGFGANGASIWGNGAGETKQTGFLAKQGAVWGGRRPMQELAPAVNSHWVGSHEMVERPSSTLWVQAEVPSSSKERDGLWFSGLTGVSMFKECQEAAMRTLVPTDYMMMQGKPFIKKSGWRKIAFFFNISFEIKDKNIQFDPNANVLRAEFTVRASMPSGRFTDSWGSCDRGEKRFSKPNHDIPSTAETRAKTRACQDLLGIGEYKSDGGVH